MMRDLMMEMYDAFLADPVISKHLGKEDIKFYDFPNADTIKNNVMVIDEIISPGFKGYADNDPLAYEYLYQVDIFVKQNSNNVNGSLVSRELILRVQKVMWKVFEFSEFNSMKPEHIKDYNLYRTSKQFRGRKYINEMEQL